jgi:hypothetical protein
MIRMERVGVYLRSFERASWADQSGDPIKDTSFFIWENFLWSPPSRFYRAGYRKQNTGYAGVAIFYAMMFAGSMIAFFILSAWWLSLVVGLVLTSLGCFMIIPPAIQIFALGGAAPTISNEELSLWANSLPEEKKGFLAQSAMPERARRLLMISKAREAHENRD